MAPDPFNTAAEPALTSGAGGTVTLVAGGTFCLSDATGDVAPGAAHGLFFSDARLLSRWQLRLDGRVPHALTVAHPEAFAARFVLRRPPAAGQADSTLLLVRERLVGDGMRETVSVHNLDREATVVRLDLHVAADFADLFAVKEGRAADGGARSTAGDGELVVRAGALGVSVRATAEPTVEPGTLSWRVVVPAGQRWSTEIVVSPTGNGRPVRPRFERGEPWEDTEPAREIRAWRAATTTVSTADPVLA
ncbi:glycogen debranching N-terminal domain-containing protein, partial [Actinophytocola sp.]|uniref:glycogen debranching N-terminal domain-containing protein n=1 Tax=Actinophytocola sp. TaxID=1872138 RepID=UPI00389AB643